MTDRSHSPRKRLRALLSGGSYVIAPGAYDALSARLIQEIGFDAVYLTGGGFSRSNGYPDMGLLTMTEILQWIARVVDAVSIPVIADADNGYGNAVNVVRTGREAERAGVAAFHLEDQVAPKKCGHYEGKEVVSLAEMVGKLHAAVDTRRDGDLVSIARTDARAILGLAAAIERANAYIEAGADLAFVEAPQSLEELARIPREVRGPVMVNIFEGGKTPVVSAQDLEKMGFCLGIYPSQVQRAAIRAAREVLAALRADGDTRKVEHLLATFEDREQAVGTPQWRALEARYLSQPKAVE